MPGQKLDEDGDRRADEDEAPRQLLVEKAGDEHGHQVRLRGGKVAIPDPVHAVEKRPAGRAVDEIVARFEPAGVSRGDLHEGVGSPVRTLLVLGGREGRGGNGDGRRELRDLRFRAHHDGIGRVVKPVDRRDVLGLVLHFAFERLQVNVRQGDEVLRRRARV